MHCHRRHTRITISMAHANHETLWSVQWLRIAMMATAWIAPSCEMSIQACMARPVDAYAQLLGQPEEQTRLVPQSLSRAGAIRFSDDLVDAELLVLCINQAASGAATNCLKSCRGAPVVHAVTNLKPAMALQSQKYAVARKFRAELLKVRQACHSWTGQCQTKSTGKPNHACILTPRMPSQESQECKRLAAYH